jgi:hypothetical protein
VKERAISVPKDIIFKKNQNNTGKYLRIHYVYLTFGWGSLERQFKTNRMLSGKLRNTTLIL